MSLAISGAVDLTDTLGKHGDDPAVQALVLDELAAAHVVPFQEDQTASTSRG